MKFLHALLNLLAGLVLSRFTISKFAAWPESVAGFEDMAATIGIDPTLFRLTSGVIIGIAALSFFINSAIILFGKEKGKGTIILVVATALWGIGSMVGALVSEFFLRTQPAWMLVYIAIGVISIALANLFSYRKSLVKLASGSSW